MKNRLGLFGASQFLKSTYLKEIVASGFFEITGLASLSKNKSKTDIDFPSINRYQDYDSLGDKSLIDIAYISTSNDLHYSLAYQLIDQGIHCIIEKPMVGSLDEFIKLKSLAMSRNTVFFENFNFLYHQQYKFLMKAINEHVYGEIRDISISFGFPEFRNNQNFRYKKLMLGGAFMDAGVYVYRLASQIMDFETTSCFMVNNHLDNYEVDMSGSCLIYNNRFSVRGSWGFSNFYRCEVDIWFESGRLIFPRFFTAKPDFNASVRIQSNTESKEISFRDNQYLHSLEYFTKIIQSQNLRSEYYRELNNYYNIVASALEKAK